jgi:hypothetical protein
MKVEIAFLPIESRNIIPEPLLVFNIVGPVVFAFFHKKRGIVLRIN